MRMKRFYMPTLREVPTEAEIPSHRLLLRAAMIRKTSSGLYSYLPLGYRSVLKVEKIVREEMDRSGAQEIRVPYLHPREFWEETDRWATFGPEMFRVKDRHGNEFALGPTAEEPFTDLVRQELRSYKQLPLNLYQIGWKYRDEKRPRYGINRSREFLMKDAYSFDLTKEGMEESYQIMWDAYSAVFDRLHLDYRIVQGDSGAMGGKISHEFMALSEIGEGVIVFSESGYAATDEKATMMKPTYEKEEMLPVEEVYTPNIKTIDDLVQFSGIPAEKMMKAICLRVKDDPVFVFIPAERELNMTKLTVYLQVPGHMIEMLDEATIEEVTGAPGGFIGPVGLKGARVILDKAVTERANLVCGANKMDTHIKNVNYGRDFTGEVVDDLWMVAEGDLDPIEGKPLQFARGIEVGNIFQLGTKYSESMGAYVSDENGAMRPLIMGCYGIGVTRILTAIIEQNHDDEGILWPIIAAPYTVMITVIKPDDPEQMALADKIHDTLEAEGIDVLLDDRDERPGVKFNDRDLIGIPLRITVGKKAGEGVVEYSTRRARVNEDVSVDEALKRIRKAYEER